MMCNRVFFWKIVRDYFLVNLQHSEHICLFLSILHPYHSSNAQKNEFAFPFYSTFGKICAGIPMCLHSLHTNDK